MKKNNDTKDYSEQLEFLNSQPYYASKKIVIQLSDSPVRHTGSYRHKKSTAYICNELPQELLVFLGAQTRCNCHFHLFKSIHCQKSVAGI